MGPEVTDRLLEPMLGGIYAGRARELSFAAVAHGLFEQARQPGRLVDHAQSIARPSTGTPVFAGLTGGITQLVDALLAELGGQDVRLRSSTTVRDLVRRPDGRFAVTLAGPGPTASETLVVDAVVLAAPARVTGQLVAVVRAGRRGVRGDPVRLGGRAHPGGPGAADRGVRACSCRRVSWRRSRP